MTGLALSDIHVRLGDKAVLNGISGDSADDQLIY